MPLDRNKMLRYQVLDRCFRDTSRLYKAKDLLECCNRELSRYDFKQTSLRTIQKDIEDLQGEPHNVEFDSELRKTNHYRYFDLSFKLSVLKLSAPARDALEKTIALLRERCSDADDQNPQWQWMLVTLQAIADDRPVETAGPYVSFENNVAFSGNIHFATLLEAIINRHPLKIRYKPFKHKVASEKVIHPYHLKQYNSRWFLFAFDSGMPTSSWAQQETGNAISCFALDRILRITLSKGTYIPTDVDFTTYFDNVMGVTVNDSMLVEQITLRVSASRYPYVETKPFSENQRTISHDETSYTIRFPMKINNELIAKILSYGSDIEVIRPLHLRETIATIIEQMHNKYDLICK